MKKSLEILESFGEPVSRDMKETLAHGSRQFRMSVHMTRVPPINNVVLYSHWHEELEFLFLAKGSALVHIGQEKVAVRSGEVVFIPMNLLHSASRLDQGKSFFMPCWCTSIFSPAWKTTKFNSNMFCRYLCRTAATPT